MNLENHISLTSSATIDELCKPLKDFFNIVYFQFRRTFNDRSRIVLSNRPDFIRHYYEHKRYDSYGTFENRGKKIGLDTPLFGVGEEHFKSAQLTEAKSLRANKKVSNHIQSSFVLWSALENNPLFDDIFADCRAFDMYNGITLAEEGYDYCSFYHFAAKANDVAAVSLFVQNIDLLKRFILYFKEQASELILQADKTRIIAPTVKEIVHNASLTPHSISSLDKEKFLKSTPLKRVCIDERKNIMLSRKEAVCASSLVQGMSARQIGEYMCLSSRTIEDTITQLKHKFKVKNKSALIEQLIKTDYAELFVKSSLMT